MSMSFNVLSTCDFSFYFHFAATFVKWKISTNEKWNDNFLRFFPVIRLFLFVKRIWNIFRRRTVNSSRGVGTTNNKEHKYVAYLHRIRNFTMFAFFQCISAAYFVWKIVYELFIHLMWFIVNECKTRPQLCRINKIKEREFRM